jgi:hypothetical protein
VTPRTEITVVGGQRVRAQEDLKAVEGAVLSAARGSIMEFAWVTDAESGERVGVNPEHVVMLRDLTVRAFSG